MNLQWGKCEGWGWRMRWTDLIGVPSRFSTHKGTSSPTVGQRGPTLWVSERDVTFLVYPTNKGWKVWRKVQVHNPSPPSPYSHRLGRWRLWGRKERVGCILHLQRNIRSQSKRGTSIHRPKPCFPFQPVNTFLLYPTQSLQDSRVPERPTFPQLPYRKIDTGSFVILRGTS